jgi:hypothetical protein
MAYMGFPAQHRAKIHSTNPIVRLNGEITRRSDVVGLLRKEAAVIKQIGAILLEQNDEWAVQCARYWKPSSHSVMIPMSACRPCSLIEQPILLSMPLLHHGLGRDRRGNVTRHRSPQQLARVTARWRVA